MVRDVLGDHSRADASRLERGLLLVDRADDRPLLVVEHGQPIAPGMRFLRIRRGCGRR